MVLVLLLSLLLLVLLLLVVLIVLLLLLMTFLLLRSLHLILRSSLSNSSLWLFNIYRLSIGVLVWILLDTGPFLAFLILCRFCCLHVLFLYFRKSLHYRFCSNLRLNSCFGLIVFALWLCLLVTLLLGWLFSF